MSQHPFDLPEDFPYAELGHEYGTGNYTIEEISAEFGISTDTFKAIRKAAPQTWTKGGVNLWWDELDESEEDLAREASSRAKAAKAAKMAKQRERRQDRKAIRKWHRLEEAIQKASESFQNSSYAPPKPRVKICSQPPQEAGVIVNGQDFHIGKRPKESEPDYHNRYVEALKEGFASGLKSMLRQYQSDTLHLVTGGDLIHVDNFQEATTSGTPQDTLLTPTQAITEAVSLLRWMIDYSRSLGLNVVVVPVTGNHDKVLGQAASIAVGQRFHSAADVKMLKPDNRVYFRYGDHLVLATHGDMKKRQWRKLPSLMMQEARQLLAKTKFQEVISGHLHFQAQDLHDESGTLFNQGSSPSPLDEWHDHQGYRSRRGMQMLAIQPDSAATTVQHQPVTI